MKTKQSILQENSTHKAIKDGKEIKIYIKGFDCEDLHWEDELLYTLPLSQKDDLLAIFDRFDEDNRCNLAELNDELSF